MPIEINHPDAIWVSRDLYCKSPEALATALEAIKAIGYKVQDNRLDGYGIKEDRVTPREMELEGWSLTTLVYPTYAVASAAAARRSSPLQAFNPTATPVRPVGLSPTAR